MSKDSNEFYEKHFYEFLLSITNDSNGNLINEIMRRWQQYKNTPIIESTKASHTPPEDEKKEWEIVSFKDKHNEGEFYTKDRYGRWGNAMGSEFWTDSVLLRDGFPIHSVRRLSDGVLFSVGDKVNAFHWGIQTIERFHVDGNIMVVKFGTCGNPLDKISHAPKVEERKPLFVTEDGVDVFENSEVWAVYIDVTETPSMLKGKECAWATYGGKFLSTKEKAEEYILLNKPVLSVNDVFNLSTWYSGAEENQRRTVGVNEIKNLAKQKIDNNGTK